MAQTKHLCTLDLSHVPPVCKSLTSQWETLSSVRTLGLKFTFKVGYPLVSKCRPGIQISAFSPYHSVKLAYAKYVNNIKSAERKREREKKQTTGGYGPFHSFLLSTQFANALLKNLSLPTRMCSAVRSKMLTDVQPRILWETHRDTQNTSQIRIRLKECKPSSSRIMTLSQNDKRVDIRQ